MTFNEPTTVTFTHLSFHWEPEEVNGMWKCTVVDAAGQEVYVSGGNNFDADTPESAPEKRRSYQKEIIEEYTGEWIP